MIFFFLKSGLACRGGRVGDVGGDSDGEQEETCHWLRTSVSCGYLEGETGRILADKYSHVSGMLNNMMNEADSWCRGWEKKG